MSANVSSDRPPSPPKTAGRKKIKIQRIEDSRNRQVTFLKRKNGLLKKAMELGILCDCEVTVIIFNLNNGKLFEYSSVEPETVLQKYATYNGPSERRKKERFFELAASKGTSNIPVNEPKLAQAAMDASAAAARRPRPTHKFKNSDTQPGAEQYYNGRKLSSGESPGNLAYRLETPHEIPPGPELEPTRIRAPAHTDSFHMHPTSGVVSQHAQNQHVIAGRPPSMSIAPALPSQLSAPSMFTPSTAGRHLSAALGLPTPSAINGQSARFPFIQKEKEPDHNAASTMLPPPYLGRTSITPKRETQLLRTETRSVQPKNEFAPLPNPREILAPAGGSAVSHSTENAEVTLQASVVSSEGQLHSDGQLQESSQRVVPRLRPNLTVAIPNPNREDFASGTPSGLHSMSSPSSGNESFRGLMSARLPGMTPTGLGAWAPWNQLTPSERDSIPVPLTPFLNYNLDGSGDSAQLGFGSGHHFSLPSPTNAGLLPLTPRVIGYDPLATSRAEGQSLLPSKRSIDHLFDQTDNQFPKRQR